MCLQADQDKDSCFSLQEFISLMHAFDAKFPHVKAIQFMTNTFPTRRKSECVSKGRRFAVQMCDVRSKVNKRYSGEGERAYRCRDEEGYRG